MMQSPGHLDEFLSETRAGRTIRTAWGLFTSTRPLIIIPVLFTPAAAATMAARGLPALKPALLGLAVVALSTAAAHIFNDYCDRELDRINPRTWRRAVARGVLRPRVALLLATSFMGASAILAYLINVPCFLMMLCGILLIVSYSAWAKRRIFGFLWPALAASVLTMAAWAAFRPVDLFSTAPILIAAIGFSFELEPYWLQSILDTGGDRSMGMRTIPAVVGVKITSWIMLLAYAASFAALIALHKVAGLSALYLLLVLAGGGLILIGYIAFALRQGDGLARLLFVLSMGFIAIVSAEIAIENMRGWPSQL